MSPLTDDRWNPVPDQFLPEGFALREDEDFAYVVCSRCGHLSCFSGAAAVPEALIAAANAHAHTCRVVARGEG